MNRSGNGGSFTRVTFMAKSMSYQIRKRDGWSVYGLPTANSCGAAVVHHVKPLSENGPALDEKNLVSLCAECHRKAHGVVEDEQKTAWQSIHSGIIEPVLI